MALTDEVQNRYSSQILINASNPQNTGPTTIDTTRLNNAITDVQAAFKKRGITYDNSVDTHVATAVPGVFARLLVMTGQQGGLDLWREFIEDLELLSETTSRNRIKPTTDSVLSPSAKTAGAKPVTDWTFFDKFVSKPPGSAQVQD